MKKLFAAAVIALALTGCASVPMGDAEQDAALKTFVITPEKAGIYIYRNESFGSANRLAVEIDKRVIGETAAKTYLYKEVTPGKHTIVSHAENTDTLEVDVKPGTLVYVWQEIKLGFLFARSKLHLMSEEEGKKGVLETNLAQTR